MAGYKFPEIQLFLRSNVGTLILFVQAIPFLSYDCSLGWILVLLMTSLNSFLASCLVSSWIEFPLGWILSLVLASAVLLLAHLKLWSRQTHTAFFLLFLNGMEYFPAKR